MENKKIIGVQFEPVGKIYHFNSASFPDLQVDDQVVVNTSRGVQVARIVKTDISIDPGSKEEIRDIERPATPKDLLIRQMMADKEDEALTIAQDYIRSGKLQGIKVVSTEYSFDGNNLTIIINSEADPKFNVKSFHQEISHKFKDVKIEIRQVGPRDVAKALGGMGACGLETRCCSKYLTEFSSISIRMAKSQDISLTPSEITGMCGRLRCCLDYEYELYEDARKNMPKVKKLIQTPLGEGKVIQILPLAQNVVVYIPELGRRQFSMHELETGKMSEPESIPIAEVIKEEPNEDIEFVSTQKAVTIKSQRGLVDKRQTKDQKKPFRNKRGRRRR